MCEVKLKQLEQSIILRHYKFQFRFALVICYEFICSQVNKYSHFWFAEQRNITSLVFNSFWLNASLKRPQPKNKIVSVCPPFAIGGRRLSSHATNEARDVDQMLAQCWANVVDVGSTLKKLWSIVQFFRAWIHHRTDREWCSRLCGSVSTSTVWIVMDRVHGLHKTTNQLQKQRVGSLAKKSIFF